MNRLEVERCKAKWAKHATPAGAPILRNIAFSTKATNYTPEMRQAAKELLATIPVTQVTQASPALTPVTAGATESLAAASEPQVPTTVALEDSDAAGMILEAQGASQD